MSYLDGIHYGYDQISSSPNLPLTFSAAEWENRPILATRNEYPHKKPLEYPTYDDFSIKPLRRVLKDPTIAPDDGKQDNKNNEKFTQLKLAKRKSAKSAKRKSKERKTKEQMTNLNTKFIQISEQQIITLLFVLIIFVIVMQVKLYERMHEINGLVKLQTLTSTSD